MATRQEIIGVIDALLEGKITPEEARHWAGKEVWKTPHCEDPSSALFTLIGITDPIVQKSEPWQKELPRDREVLARGVPCPRKELGKTVEAYWLAFAPWKKVVLSQIRKTEKGERILELIEEDWNGKQKFYHQMSLPITEEPGLPLSSGEIQEKEEYPVKSQMNLFPQIIFRLTLSQGRLHISQRNYLRFAGEKLRELKAKRRKKETHEKQ